MTKRNPQPQQPQSVPGHEYRGSAAGNHHCSCGLNFYAPSAGKLAKSWAAHLKRVAPKPVKWTAADERKAFAEGWNVFDSDSRGIEIERDDSMGAFASDDDAERYVRARAVYGSALHARALAYVEQEKRKETQP